MFYSHFIIIYKVNETSLVIFKYNQISEKCKKNLILKKIFQNNQVSKEFINIVLLSFMSTGSFNLKKKSVLNVLFEVTYKLNLEDYIQKYYLAKFLLKTASLILINIDCYLTQKFHCSRIIKNSLQTSITKTNFYKKEFNDQNYTYNNEVTKYRFKLSKSKLSTSYFDEILNLNLKLTHNNLYYSKSFSCNNSIKN